MMDNTTKGGKLIDVRLYWKKENDRLGRKLNKKNVESLKVG